MNNNSVKVLPLTGRENNVDWKKVQREFQKFY